MLSHSVYNVLHVIGIILVMAALGGLCLHTINGGTREGNPSRRLIVTMHGTGVLLILLGGFGMLARIGFEQGEPFPGWLVVKISIWLLLAVAVMIPYRRPALARPLLLALPVLGGLAAIMAIYKPL
jgi:hypothetical protein